MTSDSTFFPPSARIQGRPEWPEQSAEEHSPAKPDLVRDVDVAIVGGGPSGLIAAYRLRQLDILLLEREEEVGGNARADSWRGIVYPAGAIVTYSQSPAMELYEELGLSPERIPQATDSAVILDGLVLEGDLWGSTIDELYSPSAARGLRRARRELLDLDVEAHRERLDRLRLSSLLRDYPPEVKHLFDRLLRWFACTTDDVSAYVGVYLARSQMGEGLGVVYPEGTSEGGAYSFPEGLSRPALALRAAIEEAGADRVWTESTVYSVRQSERGVSLKGVRSGRAFSIDARFVIMAASKYVAKSIIRGIPAAQKAAMEAIRYVPYLVGAVGTREAFTRGLSRARTLDGPMATIREMGSGDGPRLLRCELPFRPTDFPASLGTADLQSFGRKVVTYLDDVFPGARRKVEEVRIWRRGHNWYVPTPGFVTRVQQRAARPLGRIYFANADSVGPISEFGWALVAAERAAAAVKSRIGKQEARTTRGGR